MPRNIYASDGFFKGKTISDQELYNKAVEMDPSLKGQDSTAVVDRILADHPERYKIADEPPQSIPALNPETGIRGTKRSNMLVEAGSNLIPSFFKQAANRVTGPIDTILAVGGAAKELWDTPVAEMPSKLANQVAYTGRSIIDYGKSRYGSLDKLEDTFRNDPVGIVGDVAALVAGGGALTKGAGKVASAVGRRAPASGLSKVGAALESKGSALSVAGDNIDPTIGPVRWAYGRSQTWRERVAKQSYDAILGTGGKGPTLKQFEDASSEVWKRRIPIGEEGVAKIDELSKARDEAVKAAVARGMADGKTISTEGVVKDALVPEWERVAGQQMALKKAEVWDAAGDKRTGFLNQEGQPIRPVFLIDEATKKKVGPFIDRDTAIAYAAKKGIKGDMEVGGPVSFLDEKIPRQLRDGADYGHMPADGVFEQNKVISVMDEDGNLHDLHYQSSPMSVEDANKYRMGGNRDTQINKSYLQAAKGIEGDARLIADRAILDDVRKKLYEEIKDYNPPKEGWAESGRTEKRLLDAKAMIENSILDHKSKSPLGGSGPYVWASGAMTLSSLLTGSIPALLPAMVTAIGTIKSVYGHDPGAASKLLFKLVEKYPNPSLWGQVANAASRPVSEQEGSHFSRYYKPPATQQAEPPRLGAGGSPAPTKPIDDIGPSPYAAQR